MVLGQVQWNRVYWPGLQVADLCLYLCCACVSFLFVFVFVFACYPGSQVTYIDVKEMPCLLGLIWSEIKQLWDVGLKEYISDM